MKLPSGLKKTFAAVVATTVIGGGGFMYATSNVSKGGRAGIVGKLSERQGMFFLPMCSSWEGTLSGLDPIAFSVKDPEIVKQLEAVRKSGQMVDLKYEQKRFPSLYSCVQDSAYVITGVEVMGGQGTAPAPIMIPGAPKKK